MAAALLPKLVVGPCRILLADSSTTATGRPATRFGSRAPHGIVFILRSGIPWQCAIGNGRAFGIGCTSVQAGASRGHACGDEDRFRDALRATLRRDVMLTAKGA